MASLNDFLQEWHDDKPFVLAHTSGSTGEPKAICLLKSDMRLSALATNKFFGIGSDDILGIPLSFDYIAAKMMAVRAEVAGCAIKELPVSNNISFDGPISLLSVVPTQLSSLLSIPGIEQRVKHLLIGGASVSSQQEKSVVESGIDAYIGYGMTETCSHVALRRIGTDDVYRAMDGISFDIDDRGCLIIKADQFSWKRLVTNDVIELINEKTFRWLGRIDNVVNSGGLKLFPEKLEELYRTVMPELKDFYLIGEPDKDLGQRLVIVCVKSPSNPLVTLRERISDHRLLPKRVIFVDNLTRTASGKIKREKI